MPAKTFFKRRSKLSLAALICVALVSGAATLAKADWHSSVLPRVENELYRQSKNLSKLNEVWALNAKSRVDLVIYKLNAAQVSSSPAAEFTHLEHACRALIDLRTILLGAQDEDSRQNEYIDLLIEQTFEHREAIGCRE
jgi:hypothetical protein